MWSFWWFCRKFLNDETSCKLLSPIWKINATLQSACLLVGKYLNFNNLYLKLLIHSSQKIIHWCFQLVRCREKAQVPFIGPASLPPDSLWVWAEGPLICFTFSLWMVPFMTYYLMLCFSLCVSLPDMKTVIPLSFLFFSPLHLPDISTHSFIFNCFFF